tara:strand:- start:482 stop:700 length:219 start_codon:yes stop_codon:yes gene_type:complete
MRQRAGWRYREARRRYQYSLKNSLLANFKCSLDYNFADHLRRNAANKDLSRLLRDAPTEVKTQNSHRFQQVA